MMRSLFSAFLSLLAAVLMGIASSMAAMAVFSKDWYTGAAGSQGIMNYCTGTDPVEPVGGDTFTLTEFCVLDWSKLEDAYEKAAIILLFIATVAGLISTIWYLMTSVGRSCFTPRRWPGVVAVFLDFITFICSGAALLTVSHHYHWGAPEGMTPGVMFYLLSGGCSAALLAFILAICILAWDKRTGKKELEAYMRSKEELGVSYVGSHDFYSASKGGTDDATSKSELYHS